MVRLGRFWVSVRGRAVFRAIQDSRVSERTGRANERTNETMPEILFSEKWWQMPQDDYNESKQTLKALIAKEQDSGNAEVVLKIRLVGR